LENIIGLLEQAGYGYKSATIRPNMKARLARNSPATRRKPASERAKKPSQASDKPSPASDNKAKRVLSEDEADILYCEKHKHERAIPWEQVKAKLDAMDG
jgi:hypothetical protein